MDLVPLILSVVGPIAYVGIAAISYRRGESYRIRGVGVGIVAVAVLTIAAPYAAFFLIDGDPDVWDFYRTYAAIPAVLMVAAIAIGWFLKKRLLATENTATTSSTNLPA